MGMQGFLMNNQVYESQANNQIAVLLSQFDSDYIMEVVEDTLNQVFSHFDMIPRPNIVKSFEMIFKELLDLYPTDADNINQIRIETYETIINQICGKYELRYIQTENIDLLTVADLLYDLFVAKLNIYMVNFYVKLLMEEKSSALSMINLEELRKSKDPTIVYNKMVFNNDEELVAIAINIPYILQNFANNLQIPDETVYNYIYQNKTLTDMLSECISPNVPLFNRFNSILFNRDLYGPIITHIRVLFQQTVAPPKTND